jgi:recombination protein RecA
MYGNPETTSGGRALKFYASVRIDIRRTEALKNGADIYGNTVRVKIVKNKEDARRLLTLNTRSILYTRKT